MQRITVLDLTQGDEPVITYRDEPIRRRRALADISTAADQATNMDQPVNRPRRRRRTQASSSEVAENIPPEAPTQGRGAKSSSNPWIQHVKDFAEDKGITYWEALKSPECKASYKSQSGKGFNILKAIKKVGKTVAKPFELDGVNPFQAGYNFGHDRLGPAIFGKK